MTAETALRRRHRRRGWAPSAPRRNAGPRAARLADYADLRAAGLGIAGASARVGVSRRTGDRYEAALTASGAAPWRRARVTAPALTDPGRPVAAVCGPRKGCGTYLGLLLHLDLGESPCLRCLFAGIRRTVRETRAPGRVAAGEHSRAARKAAA